MKNNWKLYMVRYMDHVVKSVEDECNGNSITTYVKARTDEEVLKKFHKWHLRVRRGLFHCGEPRSVNVMCLRDHQLDGFGFVESV
jgi:hypothetical protein